MRQPPDIMPKVMVTAQASIAHNGTSKLVVMPLVTGTRAIMPMLFCVSLVPCEKASQAGVAIWPLRK